MTETLLFLLLPVAAASGWYMAIRSARKQSSDPATISAEYFKGINYFLNEQPDKAIETFISMLEVNSDTVETHLALGNLFRRRGEVERAIRIHQNLIARPSLDLTQRSQALFELGQDYMQAGVLDRAEGLFKELIDLDELTVPALWKLNDIYEQEKEWEEAVSVTQQLESNTGLIQQDVIAQYYCELAELARQQGDNRRAKQMIKKALSHDHACVRASIVQGTMAAEEGDCKLAIKSFKQVEQQAPDYLPIVIDAISKCYGRLGNMAEMLSYLKQVVEKCDSEKLALVYAEYLGQEQGDQVSADYIAEYLHKRPSLQGLNRLMELSLRQAGSVDHGRLQQVKAVLGKILEEESLYCCSHCGFSGKSLHWQCPSCKYWGSVKPL